LIYRKADLWMDLSLSPFHAGGPDLGRVLYLLRFTKGLVAALGLLSRVPADPLDVAVDPEGLQRRHQVVHHGIGVGR
jgi:hypothetical protein